MTGPGFPNIAVSQSEPVTSNIMNTMHWLYLTSDWVLDALIRSVMRDHDEIFYTDCLKNELYLSFAAYGFQQELL